MLVSAATWSGYLALLSSSFGMDDDGASVVSRRNMQMRDPWYCTHAVNRLKKGPADINSILNSDEVFSDATFRGNDTVFWDGFTD